MNDSTPTPKITPAGHDGAAAHTIAAVLARFGAPIPGGCGTCAAYQTVRVHDGLTHVTVHHDDDCPTYRRMRRRSAR